MFRSLWAVYSDDLLDMLLGLLLVGPFYKLLPVAALMLGSKPVNPIGFFIHYLQGGVSGAHKRLAQEIDTMADMTRLDVHMNIFILELLSKDCCVMVDPIASPNVVLYKRISIVKLSCHHTH